jgi:hypothetical protein
MSGGGGHIILARSAQTALGNPLVHGQMPAKMAAEIDEIFAKDPGTWTHSENTKVAKAFEWGLLNCT